MGFLEREKLNINAVSCRLNLSALSLSYDTRLSVISWSHLLLISSICCPKDPIEYYSFTNRLKSVNLASKLLVSGIVKNIANSETINALNNGERVRLREISILRSPLWCHRVLLIWNKFFCPWFEICKKLMNECKHSNHRILINIKWNAIWMKYHPICCYIIRLSLHQ